MKNYNLIIILCLILGFCQNASAQWQQTNGPIGGQTLCIERIGNELWVGTNDGIYISNDDGLSWVKSPLINFTCTDIRAYNDTVLILYIERTSDENTPFSYNILFSNDNGFTWAPPRLILSSYFYDLSRFSAVKNNHLLFKKDYEYYASNDLGLTWTLMPEIESSSYAWIKYIGNNAYACIYSGGQYSYKYFRADNYSPPWQEIFATNVNNGFYLSDTIILAGIETGITPATDLIQRSYDHGNSWDTVLTLDTGHTIYELRASQDTLLLVVMDSLYNLSYFNSSDGGNVWNEVFTPPQYPYFYGYDTVVVTGGDILEADCYLGILRFDISNDTAYYTNTGLRISNISSLYSHNGTLYAYTDIGPYTSNDMGQMWTPFVIPGMQSTITFNDFWFSGDTIILASQSEWAMSFDDGHSWQINAYPFSYAMYETYLSIQKINGRIYLSGDSIYYSDNMGQTWVPMPFLPEIPDTGTAFCIGNSAITGRIKAHMNSLYTITMDGYVFKYNEASNIWEYQTCFWSPGVNYNRLNSLGNVLVASHNEWIKATYDNGLTWVDLPGTGLPLDYLSSIIAPEFIISDGINWYGVPIDNSYSSIGESLGIYYSSDQGYTWNSLDNGNAPFIAAPALTICNGVLFSGAKHEGVWRRSGVFYSVSGVVYNDMNENGIKDAGEPGCANNIVCMQNSATMATTDINGLYTLITDVAGDSLKPVPLVSFASYSPSGYYVQGFSSNKNFGLTVQPGVADLTIDLTNVTPFIPGFNTSIDIIVQNNGSLVQAPAIRLILDSALSYVSSSITPENVYGDTISWATWSLGFMETQVIQVIVNSPAYAVLGDSLHSSAFAGPLVNDINPADNYYELNNEIIGSYDPNDKTCLQGMYITPEQLATGQELEFVIRFQNTGTYFANDIKITDTLSPFLDHNSFRFISASHPVEWEISGNAVIDFTFDNIQLPSDDQDEPASHGYVKFAISCKPEVVLGDAINNTSNIYFDFNLPVITNTTTTAIAYPLILELENPTICDVSQLQILAYPNPTNEGLFLKVANSGQKSFVLHIYSSNGMMVREINIRNNVEPADVSELSPGLYIGMLFDTSHNKIGSFRFAVE